MKKPYYYISVLIMLLFASCSCKKDNIAPAGNERYLVFGHFFGECGGESCIEIFKLTDNQLFEDINDNYPSNQLYIGNYITLSSQQFDITQDLFDYFPEELLNNPNVIIGQPDAGDWGGLYIEYKTENGQSNFWLIDQKKSNVPAQYHAFIDKVNNKIQQLQ